MNRFPDLRTVVVRIRKLLLIAIVNATLIIGVLYGFEFAFSPYNELPINGSSDDGSYTWGHLVTNNDLGYRERNFMTPKSPDVYRVMVLGDSLTWGAGLAVEDRCTAITEELLNEAFPDLSVEILNFGTSWGPTVRERDILLELAELVDPDLIVVGFSLNDPQPNEQSYSVEKEKLRRSVVGRIVITASKVMVKTGLPYTGELTRSLLFGAAEMLGLIPTWQVALQRAYEPSSSEWTAFVQALEDIKRTSDERKLAAPIIAVLNQGTYTDEPTDYANPDQNLKQFLGWYRKAETAARDAGFAAYHHEQEIARQLSDLPLSVNRLDGHPSAALNRIYADKLYQQIARQLKQSP